ncbi:MAG: flippase-like domain-containing protein [Lachnospiraceae bacterium]|nr:flippase-like domain-containing protein [Lachnospiraceae bacterium]
MNLLKKKSLWLGALLLLLLGGATVYVIYKELDGQDIIGTLKNANIGLILLAVLAMALYAVADGINISRCLRLAGYKISFAQMMKYSFAGFFFSSITPSSTGGQPGQLYFMAKDKLKVSHSAFTLLCALLSFQCAAVLLGIIGVIFSNGVVFGLQGRFAYVFPIGFALNLAIIAGLFCVLFTRRIAGFFAWAGLKLMSIKGLKPGDRFRFLRSFAAYRRAAALLRMNKSVFLKMFLTSLVQLILFHSVTFFCAQAIGCTGLDWFTVLRTQSSLFISVSSLPLPGAAGVTEYGYALFYSDLIPEGLLGSVMLLSRFCSFVLPLVMSGAGLVLLSIKPRKKASEEEQKKPVSGKAT